MGVRTALHAKHREAAADLLFAHPACDKTAGVACPSNIQVASVYLEANAQSFALCSPTTAPYPCSGLVAGGPAILSHLPATGAGEPAATGSSASSGQDARSPGTPELAAAGTGAAVGQQATPTTASPGTGKQPLVADHFTCADNMYSMTCARVFSSPHVHRRPHESAAHMQPTTTACCPTIPHTAASIT
jgi:hypothetical protein